MDTPARPPANGIAPRPFAERLRERRTQLGATQKETAARAGLTRTRYADCERGHVKPTRGEITRIAVALGIHGDTLLRGSDWRTPGRAPQFPKSRLREACRWRPVAKYPTASYVESALREHRLLTAVLLGRIRTREDLPLVRLFLRHVAGHSVLEAVVLLALLAAGARPVWESPLRVGFRHWPVLLRDRQAGDCRHPGLELDFRGVRLLFLFQVTLHVNGIGKPMVDALVAVREPGRSNRWVVAEVDGPLHVAEKDGERQGRHELAEARLEWQYLRTPDADPATELCRRILGALGLADSEEAAAGRQAQRKNRAERKTAPAYKRKR